MVSTIAGSTAPRPHTVRRSRGHVGEPSVLPRPGGQAPRPRLPPGGAHTTPVIAPARAAIRPARVPPPPAPTARTHQPAPTSPAGEGVIRGPPLRRAHRGPRDPRRHPCARCL